MVGTQDVPGKVFLIRCIFRPDLTLKPLVPALQRDSTDWPPGKDSLSPQPVLSQVYRALSSISALEFNGGWAFAKQNCVFFQVNRSVLFLLSTGDL